MKQLSIIVIGLGHQSVDDHLPAIKESSLIKLLGVCDIDVTTAKEVGRLYGVKYADGVEGLLNKLGQKPDAALVAVPHHEYLPIIEKVALKQIHIIKEKPFATNIEEALKIQEIVKKNNVSLQITLQRRYNPIFITFNQLIKRIGKIYSIEARYTLNIARLDNGWRASKLTAGGGALIDMGYHYIDLINWYFGLPHYISCKMSLGNRENQAYDVEDTVFLSFTYNDTKNDGDKVLGNLVVSRVYPEKEEMLTAYGSKGSVCIRRGEVLRRDLEGNVVEALERKPAWPSAMIDQLEEYAHNILQGKKKGIVEKKHFAHTAFMAAAYDSAAQGTPVQPHSYYKELLKRRIK